MCACAAIAQDTTPPVAPVPEVADPISQMPSFGAALVRMVLSLAVVIAIGVGVIWLLRRKGSPSWSRKGTGTLRVVESCSLSAGHAIHLVRIGDQFVLVGASPAGLAPLSDVMLDTDALLAGQAPPVEARPPAPTLATNTLSTGA
jgi:flagellar protein FliO/FliZ